MQHGDTSCTYQCPHTTPEGDCIRGQISCFPSGRIQQLRHTLDIRSVLSDLGNATGGGRCTPRLIMALAKRDIVTLTARTTVRRQGPGGSRPSPVYHRAKLFSCHSPHRVWGAGCLQVAGPANYTVCHFGSQSCGCKPWAGRHARGMSAQRGALLCKRCIQPVHNKGQRHDALTTASSNSSSVSRRSCLE